MSKIDTPPSPIWFCRALVAVIDSFLEAQGMSESALSRAIFNHSDGIKPMRCWDGIRRSPTLESLLKVESYLRSCFDEDPNQSERLYQEALDRELRKGRPSITKR